MEKFLQGLELSLPGDQVQPGATWKARRPLPIDNTWKVLELLPPQIWIPVEGDTVEVTFTYVGVRTVKGAEQAVISLKGQMSQQPGAGSGSGGRVFGTAVVDLATGQIVEEEATTQANVEVIMFPAGAIKAQGTMVARLRRQ